jgi:creatinine amidohydrolase
MSPSIGRRVFLGTLATGTVGSACAVTEKSVTGNSPERTTTVQGAGLTAQNSFAEVEAAAPELAIFSLAAIEQHGETQPVGTDFFTISAILKEVAKRLNVYVLPTMPIGTSREHMIGAGTITMQQMTLHNYVRDIVISLYDQGFKYVAYMTGHGGNFLAEPALEELNREYPDRIAVWVRPDGDPTILESTKPDIHGGEGELSSMMYLHPNDVHKEKAVDSYPPIGREVFDYAYVEDFSKPGIWGTPTLATAEKGRRRFEKSVESTVEKILALFPEIEKRKGGGA